MTTSATRGPYPGRGFELPLRLLLAFRTIVDELHDELARRGHPGARPLHGFALQAIGDGLTASQLGAALGVSKQAAGKLVHRLDTLGYIQRGRDGRDGRRKVIRLTDDGRDCLRQSARVFDAIRQRWADELGADTVHALEHDLAQVTGPLTISLDAPGWLLGTDD